MSPPARVDQSEFLRLLFCPLNRIPVARPGYWNGLIRVWTAGSDVGISDRSVSRSSDLQRGSKIGRQKVSPWIAVVGPFRKCSEADSLQLLRH